MKALLLITALFICFKVQAEGLKVAELKRTTPVNFNKEIYPFFKRNCLACHNHSKAKAKLILETADDIRKGSSDGAVVVPGNAAKSLLFTSSAHLIEDIMPPEKNKSKAKNLTPNELALLKLWINQGAKGSGAVIAEAPKKWLKFKSNQPVYALTVSPDGRYAASGHGHHVDIYDLKLRKQIARLNDPALKVGAHQDLVRSLAFDQDNTLASGGFRKIKLWTPSSLDIEPFQINSVKGAIATSTDGSWSLYIDKEMKSLKHVIHKGGKSQTLSFKEKVLKAVILTSQKEIAVCFESGKIRVMKLAAFDPANTAGKDLYYEWQGHNKKPSHLLSAKNFPLISADISGKVIIWDLKNKKPLKSFNNGANLNSISVWSAGNRLLTTSTKGSVMLWDINKPQKYFKSLWEDPNIKAQMTSISVDKNVARRFVTRYSSRVKALTASIKKEKESAESIEKEYQEKTKELKELQEKKIPELQAKKAEKDAEKKSKEAGLKIYSSSVKQLQTKLPSLLKNKAKSLQMHDKAKTDLVKAEKDKKGAEEQVKKYDVKYKELSTFQYKTVKQYPIAGGAISADGSCFAVAYQNGKVHLFDSVNGSFIETIETRQKIKSIFSLPDNRFALINDSGKSFAVAYQRSWAFANCIGDGKDGEILIDRVTALAFGSDSTLVSASGIPSRKGHLKLWDKKTLKLKASDLNAHNDLITGIHFSPDKQRFVTGSADGIAKIYAAGTLKKEKSLEGHGGAVLDVCWSGDGWMIATGSADKKVILWNTETGEKYKTLLGKGQEVTIVKFMSKASDGLLTAEGVGGLKANLKSLPGKFKYAFSASLTPDETMILAGGQSGTIHLWDAKKYTLIKSFEPGK